MTGVQKNVIASFLDTAAASLTGGFRASRVIYDFAGSSETPAALPCSSTPPPLAHDNAESAPSPAFPPQPRGEVSDSLERVAAEIAVCRSCALCEQRRLAVAGEGVPHPLALIVGEGPGAEEDASGKPFVGKAGQLLDKMLASIGLFRGKNCFIANIVKCRPPGNRDPAPEETAACLPFLRRQIALLRPPVILSAGRISSTTLLQTNEGISRLRGVWRQYEHIPLLPTFHPSYLLRDETQKPFAWEDMKSLCRRLVTLDTGYEHETAALRASRHI